MIEVKAEAEGRPQRALLIGIQYQEDDPASVSEQLEELAELVGNLKMIPLAPEIIRVRETHSRYLTGSGRAEEVARIAQECEAEVLVFDCRLSPSQQRNWERLTQAVIMDREEVILDIFSRRAQSRAAVLQVELARAQYYLPRLTRAWTHLSRQHGGGATTRGEGEAQIETDRRLLKRRIQQLHKELEEVSRHRDTQRKARLRRPVVQGAIVGYTNVGKSSLLAALSGTEQFVKDQLFATLDPTARRIPLPGRREVVLTDTVGFVRKLPHTLVEAFKSTLEEAVLSDFLLLVLDASSPQVEQEWETTMSVLRELGAESKKIQIVFNKMDLIDETLDVFRMARLHSQFPDAIYLSTKSGKGLDVLQRRLAEFASSARNLIRVVLPPVRYDLAALAHAEGQIFEEEYDDAGNLHMVFSINEKFRHKYTEYENEVQNKA